MPYISPGNITSINGYSRNITYNINQRISKTIIVGDILPSALLHEIGHHYTLPKPTNILDYLKDPFYYECMAWLWAIDKSNGNVSKGGLVAALNAPSQMWFKEKDKLWKYRIIARLANLCKLP